MSVLPTESRSRVMASALDLSSSDCSSADEGEDDGRNKPCSSHLVPFLPPVADPDAQYSWTKLVKRRSSSRSFADEYDVEHEMKLDIHTLILCAIDLLA